MRPCTRPSMTRTRISTQTRRPADPTMLCSVSPAFQNSARPTRALPVLPVPPCPTVPLSNRVPRDLRPRWKQARSVRRLSRRGVSARRTTRDWKPQHRAPSGTAAQWRRFFNRRSDAGRPFRRCCVRRASPTWTNSGTSSVHPVTERTRTAASRHATPAWCCRCRLAAPVAVALLLALGLPVACVDTCGGCRRWTSSTTTASRSTGIAVSSSTL